MPTMTMPDGVSEFKPDPLKTLKNPTSKYPELELAYHYTDQAGLLGILSNKTIRATDVEFLNDAQELIFSRDHLLGLLRSEHQHAIIRELENSGNLPPDRYDDIRRELRSRENRRTRHGVHKKANKEDGLLPALQALIDDLEMVAGRSGSSPFHVYVSCFCRKRSLLSQWRGYSGVGGYAIGFKPKALREIAETEENAEFDWVRYGFETACYGDHRLLPVTLLPSVTLMHDYLKALTMVKDPSFSEEEEWRLMIPRKNIDTDVEFRTGQVGVTPYLPLKFVPRDAIGEVIVGPGNHLAERMDGARQILEHVGAPKTPVRPSDSPLR